MMFGINLMDSKQTVSAILNFESRPPVSVSVALLSKLHTTTNTTTNHPWSNRVLTTTQFEVPRSVETRLPGMTVRNKIFLLVVLQPAVIHLIGEVEEV
jgi:hypothetical protein